MQFSKIMCICILLIIVSVSSFDNILNWLIPLILKYVGPNIEKQLIDVKSIKTTLTLRIF